MGAMLCADHRSTHLCSEGHVNGYTRRHVIFARCHASSLTRRQQPSMSICCTHQSLPLSCPMRVAYYTEPELPDQPSSQYHCTERMHACKLSLRKCYKNAQERDTYILASVPARAECQNDLIEARRPAIIPAVYVLAFRIFTCVVGHANDRQIPVIGRSGSSSLQEPTSLFPSLQLAPTSSCCS